ncbi:hypothetical protein ACO0RG_000201 [Hanseniaspora osmophila]
MKKASHSRKLSIDKIRGFGNAGNKNQHVTPSTTVSNTGGRKPSFTKTHHRKTSSVNSVSSNVLAEQYDRDSEGIIKSCFAKKLDPATNQLLNQYFTHVRIIEDSRYPSSRPSQDSSLTNKKKRLLIVSFNKQLKQVQLHKARQNTDGSFQIGRTWLLKELQCVERDEQVAEGFSMTLGKIYYWETHTAKERTIFIKTLIKIYMDHFNEHVPVLKNWDLGLFYLDEQSYKRAVISPTSFSSSASQNKQKESIKNEQSQKLSINTTPTMKSSIPQQTPSLVKDTISKAAPQGPVSSQVSKPADISKEKANVLQTLPYSNQNRYVSTASAITKDHQKETPNTISNPLHFEKGNYPNFKPQQAELQQDLQQNDENAPYVDDSVKTKSKFSTSSNENPYANAQQTLASPALNSFSKFATVPEESANQLSPQKIPQINARERPTENSSAAGLFVAASPQKDSGSHTQAEVISLHSSNGDSVIESKSYQNEVEFDESYQHDMEAIPFETDTTEPLNIESANAEKDHHHVNGIDTDDDDLNNPPELDDNLSSSDHLFDHFGATTKEKTTGVMHINTNMKTVREISTLHAETDMSFEQGDEMKYAETYHTVDPSSKNEISLDTFTGSLLHSEKGNNEGDFAMADFTENAVAHDEQKSNKKSPEINQNDNPGDEEENYDNDVITAMLETVNWDPYDTTESLLKKLRMKLTETQYTFNKELNSISDASLTTLSSSNVTNACDKIDSWLSFFSMELASFSKDIEYVETQNNYLQVESANKKKLWTDLSQILNDVSIDPLVLSSINNTPINVQNLVSLEAALSKLYTALNAINGGDQNNDLDVLGKPSGSSALVEDDFDDLSKMEALKERKALYNGVSKKFTERCSDIFENRIFGSFVQSQDSQELSKILPFASLTLFMKNVSPADFHIITETWNTKVFKVYEELCSRKLLEADQLLKAYSQKKLAGQTSTSMSSSEAATTQPLFSSAQSFTTTTSHRTAPFSTSTSFEPQQQKKTLLHYQDISSLLQAWESFKQTKKLDVLEDSSHSDLLVQLVECISYAQGLCSTYQNFVAEFFHLRSDELPFNEYIAKVPLAQRSHGLNRYLELESDRNIANSKLNMVSAVFNATLTSYFSGFASLIQRYAPSLGPGIMFYIENEINCVLLNSDQEFIINIYERFSKRLASNWDQFILEQQSLIDKTPLVMDCKKPIPVVLSFSQFFFNLHQEMKFLVNKYQNTETKQLEPNTQTAPKTFDYVEKSYYKLSVCVMTLLAKYSADASLQKLSKSKAETLPIKQASRSINSVSSMSGNIDSGESQSSATLEARALVNRNVLLLLNSNWLIETQGLLESETMTDVFVSSCKKVFDQQKESYADIALRKAMPKLYLFVTSAWSISEEVRTNKTNADPSKYAAYSQSNLANILSVYQSRDMNQLINRLYEDMMSDFSEFQSFVTAVTSSPKFTNELYSKLWSNLQGATVSFYLRLYSLIEKHYKGTEIKFSKNDIISAFTSCKANFSST